VIDSTHFTYTCGGSDISLGATGHAHTVWPDYRAKVHMEVLLGNHTDAFPGMITGTPYDGDPGDLVINENNPWTADHKLLGRTSVFLRLHYNDEVFSNGLPSIAFLVRGKNDIYDPRTTASNYTENAALCIADYLSNTTWGFKAAYGTEIPTADLIAAANVCDEAVPLAAGGTEPRYALNGTFPLSMKRGEVLQNLLTSCAGRITYSGGQFVIHPGAWTGPSLSFGDAVLGRWFHGFDYVDFGTVSSLYVQGDWSAACGSSCRRTRTAICLPCAMAGASIPAQRQPICSPSRTDPSPSGWNTYTITAPAQELKGMSICIHPPPFSESMGLPRRFA
jgi:hypothetical protein